MMLNNGRDRYNRRIGERTRVAGAQVIWHPLVARRRFARKRYPDKADLMDLSITGASIRAPADPLIRIGTQVVIDVGNGRGVVKVRRIDASKYADEAVYGVEFLQKNDALTELVHDTLAAQRPQDVAWRWNHAR